MTSSSEPSDTMSGPTPANAAHIDTKGNVAEAERDHARKVSEKLLHLVSEPVLAIDVLLSDLPNNDVTHRAKARATLDLKTGVARAETYAPTMREAVDQLEVRLRQQLEHRSDRRRHDPHGLEAGEGQWRHGFRPSPQRSYFDRPTEERELVRHKSFTPEESTVEEARFDKEQLDYDFFLFRNAETGRDAVLSGQGDGEVLWDLADAAELDTRAATERLDATGEPFVFFQDVDTGWGAVVYRRYDGHYGMLVPA